MFDDLRGLVEFAQAGSIAGAADRLYRTPSAITRQLQRLEAALGAEVLDRSVKPPRGPSYHQRRDANARLVQQPGGKQRVGRDETQLVAERVCAIKAALAPGLSFNKAQNDGSCVARASEGTFQIGHGKIHVIRIW
jgi:hypothetical protein